MARLEELTRGSQVKGIWTDGPVEVLDVKWQGTNALQLTYKATGGKLSSGLLFRDREISLEVATKGPALSVDAPGDLFRGGRQVRIEPLQALSA